MRLISLLLCWPAGLIKAPADSVLGESALPGLQTAAFSLCPHMAIPVCLCTGVCLYTVAMGERGRVGGWA